MRTVYFVTRRPNSEFVGAWTLGEIRARLASGELRAALFATESDGRSFSRFQRSGAQARWRTLAELLEEPPSPVHPETARPPGPGRWLSSYFIGGGASWLLLVVGQFVAALACIAVPIGVVYQLGQLSEAEQVIERAGRAGDTRVGQAAAGISVARGAVVVAGVLAFCVNAALLIVFKRANTLAQIAADQDADNEQVWHAIADLRSRVTPAPSGRQDAEPGAAPGTAD
ncbi:hypothetical protein GobsT_22660 [Gemmata obscuriglobus]|uniref:Uncharacterized protein n=1 Tax=Gemmata obscuriglobus TaxID=114 RepID=A0A2Z3H506_9BACT|nr:hypothetical protein [Gemmata obscuriglobus]AWM39412.1 hypothetical protein C1280_22100 [Gemmata obscuriglobus]QEG27510.1 hypothetical protein GobsT_22660 [Gemmata obscuriglobus]VTS04539.1 unnamed protein product [Gemmata obscuriglobus UQM 2246]